MATIIQDKDIEQAIEDNNGYGFLLKKQVKEKKGFFLENTWTIIKFTVAILGLVGILVFLLFLLYHYLYHN